MKNLRRAIGLIHNCRLLLLLLLFVLPLCTKVGAAVLPNINIDFATGDDPATIGQSLQVLILLTVLALVPSILVLMTSFTRIVIVLGFTRNALGTQSMPPNQVITGLALILTLFIMSPVFSTVYSDVWLEYDAGNIDLVEAAERAAVPLREFMLKQTRPEDMRLFLNMAAEPIAEDAVIPLHYVVPAFVISELKTAFIMGFMVYIPFLIIDMVVASTLMSMGMMMLPPVMISLPFKVLLFTLVNGWHLVVDNILRSFLW